MWLQILLIASRIVRLDGAELNLKIKSAVEHALMSEKRGIPEERHVVWGGLAAGCSICSWKRAYDPTAKAHQMPREELSERIREEFRNHKCEDFPKSGQCNLPNQ
jgi:hypothetical protein